MTRVESVLDPPVSIGGGSDARERQVERPASRRGEIRSLTGLRGVAACYVMLYHFHHYKSGSGPLHRVIFHGYLAVDLFFVLSGFVMALTYAKSFRLRPTLSTFSSFLYKRIARTYPLYLLVTLLTIPFVLTHMVNQPTPTIPMVGFNLLLCQSWGFAESIGGPTWSISTEFAAYLLFPLLVTKVVSGKPLWRWIAGTLALAALVTVATRSTAGLHQVLLGQPHRSGPLDTHAAGTIYPLLRCLGGFTFGVLAYALSLTAPIKKVISYRGLTEALAVTVLLLLTWGNSDVFVTLLFVPLVMALTVDQGVIAKIMGSPIVYWLGMVSYSIYLTHWLVLQLLQARMRNYLAARHFDHASVVTAIMVVIVMALSTLTYYGIEKPARDWLRRFSEGRKSPIELDPSAP